MATSRATVYISNFVSFFAGLNVHVCMHPQNFKSCIFEKVFKFRKASPSNFLSSRISKKRIWRRCKNWLLEANGILAKKQVSSNVQIIILYVFPIVFLNNVYFELLCTRHNRPAQYHTYT